MSAQAGIWNFDGRPIEPGFLAKFSAAIERYGPDGENTYIDGSIGITYRAFHTTLESRLERQPHRSDRGNIFTWDGRLDNRNELIPELHTNLTADYTDVAIVAAAFERWGSECFCRLIGDWALSIWNPTERELILAADYLAIRHIFYYAKGDRIWWATDITPLVLVSGDTFHVDDDYLAGYFANEPDAHLTPYREIREVPPGQLVRVQNGKVGLERYWRFGSRSRIRYKADREYEEHFRDLFRQSVRRRLRSDSAILGELSGGLDSSSIVCMADDILAKEGGQTPRLDTLSYYDSTEPDGDDSVYFSKVEEQRGRVGAHIDTSTLGTSPAPLGCGEFSASPGYLAIARNLESERASIMRSGGYRVVLSGIGGDEFMGAIPNPSAQLGDLIVQCKLFSLAKQLMAWSLVKRRPWIQLLRQATVELLPSSLRKYVDKQAEVESWIDDTFAKRTEMVARQLKVNGHSGLWLPTRRAYIGGLVQMANKLSKQRSPALVLEEVRYPYLDQDLIHFMLSIPANQLLRPGDRRSLMRRALVGYVPQQILSRMTKQFAARTPIIAVQRNWEELRSQFRSSISSRLGYINSAAFLQRLDEAKAGKRIHIVRMFRTISLELWLRNLTSLSILDIQPGPTLAIQAALDLNSQSPHTNEFQQPG